MYCACVLNLLLDSKNLISLFLCFTDNEPVPILVVGNKNDLCQEREVTEDRARSLVESREAMYLETSAMNTEHAREVFNSLLQSAFGTVSHQRNRKRLSKKLSRRLSTPISQRLSNGLNNNDPKCAIL